ncbi:flagellum-associated coiled-coil domain-containing protein 1 [Erethizon dorsatum]
MYHNPLIYCTCWDPWGLGPRKLIQTPQPPRKSSWRRSKLTPLLPVSKEHNYLQHPPATKPAVVPNCLLALAEEDAEELGGSAGQGWVPETIRFALLRAQRGPGGASHSMALFLREVTNVSPGYQLVRNCNQISVTLGDEMFSGEKQLEPAVADRVSTPSCASLCSEPVPELVPGQDGETEYSRGPGGRSMLKPEAWRFDSRRPRAKTIRDLEEQISELTTIIEQMNRDHQAARKLLCKEMEQRCDVMKQNFENKTRELRIAHKAELSELEDDYREAMKAEKSAARGKLEEMQKEYKYLKNMFHIYQDTIHDEMEDKWSKRKAEWEAGEKMEREKSLLQQKHKMIKKFELESEEEKRRMSESYSATFESFLHEKEELLKQHERDAIQLQEMRKTKEIIEEELHTQALILESLNINLRQTQLELQKEKAAVENLEKVLQSKLAEVEKHKSTIQTLTEENGRLRCGFGHRMAAPAAGVGGVQPEKPGRAVWFCELGDSAGPRGLLAAYLQHRQKIIAKNGEIYERRPEGSTSVTLRARDSGLSEDCSKKRGGS